MPCDTIQTAQVNLGKVDHTLLKQAMEKLGIRSYNISENMVTVSGRRIPDDLEVKIKRAYSCEVVLSQAKKYGWKMKQIEDFKWEVQR